MKAGQWKLKTPNFPSKLGKLPRGIRRPKLPDGFAERFKLTLSQLSGAFMLPISVMAIAGLFLGVGAAISSNVTDDFLKTHPSYIHLQKFGLFIKAMGNPVFGSLPILFAAAFVIAFTKEAGVGVFATIVAYVVFVSLQEVFITSHEATQDLQFSTINGDPHKFSDLHAISIEKSKATIKTIDGYTVLFAGAGRNPTAMKELVSSSLGITSLQTSVFGGIIVGLVVAYLYNKFHTIQLPTVISFFGGKRFVALVSIVAMIPLAFLFLIFWPWVGLFLNLFGNATGNAPKGLESFIFGYIERSLIPFGLHHVFYAPLWYTSAGGSYLAASQEWMKSGHTYTGDALTLYNSVLNGSVDATRWSGDSFMSVSVAGLGFNNVTWTDKLPNHGGTTHAHSQPIFQFFADQLHIRLGRYLQGKYPFMQFALPAAAAAMIWMAPKENRRLAAGAVIPAALTSFVTGVTEPIEFTFLFLSPFLFWGFHAFMCALAFCLMNILGAHIAQTFSGGFIDLVLYGIIPLQKGTHFWWWAVIGIIYAPIYFAFFSFWIKRHNIPTPGRGDSVKLFTKADYREKVAQKASAIKQTVTGKVDQQVQDLVAGLGGFENITSYNNCASRLRYDVIDKSKVNEQALKAAGAFGVRWIGANHVQVIMGPKAEQVNAMIINANKLYAQSVVNHNNKVAAATETK